MEEDGERSYKSLGLSDRACVAMELIGGGRPPDRFLSSSLTHLISGGDFKCSLPERLRSLKIATYMVTIIEKLKKHRRHGKGGVRALILTATRDMASHTLKRAKEFFRSPDIELVLLDGGESDVERLGRNKPVAVIVTPDTLISYLSAADGMVSLRNVELLVIDGAYEMLQVGVADHLNQILGLGQLGEHRQTLVYTTEMTAEVGVLANKFLLPRHKVAMPLGRYERVMHQISSLTLGQEQPCVGVGQPQNLQGYCPPLSHDSFDAKEKKRATHDGMEEAGRFKKRAEMSMDED